MISLMKQNATIIMLLIAAFSTIVVMSVSIVQTGEYQKQFDSMIGKDIEVANTPMEIRYVTCGSTKESSCNCTVISPSLNSKKFPLTFCKERVINND